MNFYHFFNILNIDNRHSEMYISMKVVIHIFIVREIELFKVK